MTALRLFLGVLFGVLLMLATFSLPGQFAHMADEEPDQAYLRWPLTAVSVFWVLCIQVVIVCMWKLLTRVAEDRIFSEASLAWVDGIVWAIGAARVVLAGVFLYVVLMVVMRALLRQATSLRTDLETVI